ncbi:DUF5709 domain-containing protein [Microlunatus panaciterrae]|uniref:DUF5709 domain-containing protein n=1 Tax=Microlunatus panaciterrae TaxID=400768 RepID=A0ABS2RGX3_9ACTN|nr:DUF5709 domain-containing protein [Microlunatus panaciterrae]MBM7797787.1 hypothetical protein [Microlunatus panaciterrae]
MTDYTEDVPDPSEQNDQIQFEDSLVDRGVDDILDEGYSPPERWSAAEAYGNTPEEMAEGETLEQRLAQEEPEAEFVDDEDYVDDGEVGDERAGRLVDPNSGIGEDIDAELIGEDVGIDGAGASAEEAAVHIVRDHTE